MRWGVLASALLGLAACGEPAISVHLALPNEPAAPATFDYSCIGSVDVLPIANDDNAPINFSYREGVLMQPIPCIDLDHPPTSAADFGAQLHGKLDIAVPPSGLAGIALRARTGHCGDDPYRESILYGGGVYDSGSSQLDVTVNHNISCNQATMATIRPIDMFATADSGTCTSPTAGFVYVGDTHPSDLVPVAQAEIYEDGLGQGQIMAGVDAPKVPTYAGSYAGSCIVAGYQDTAGTIDSATCINAAAPAICGNPGDVIVPYVPEVYMSNTLDALASKIDTSSGETPVLGMVFATDPTSGKKVPVANAQISIDESANAQVFYGNRGDAAVQTFSVVDGMNATTSSGMFVLAGAGLVHVRVSAPNHATAEFNIGAGDVFQPTALIMLQ